MTTSCRCQGAKAAAEAGRRDAAAARPNAADEIAGLQRSLSALSQALQEAAALVLRCCSALDAAAAVSAASQHTRASGQVRGCYSLRNKQACGV